MDRRYININNLYIIVILYNFTEPGLLQGNFQTPQNQRFSVAFLSVLLYMCS